MAIWSARKDYTKIESSTFRKTVGTLATSVEMIVFLCFSCLPIVFYPFNRGYGHNEFTLLFLSIPRKIRIKHKSLHLRSKFKIGQWVATWWSFLVYLEDPSGKADHRTLKKAWCFIDSIRMKCIQVLWFFHIQREQRIPNESLSEKFKFTEFQDFRSSLGRRW